MEAAAGLCLSRTHYDIEIEHYLVKLMDAPESDLQPILKAFGIEKARLSAELNRSLDKLKSGNARNPALSPMLVRMFTEAWTIGSIEFNAGKVRTGHTIMALMLTEETSVTMEGTAPRITDCILNPPAGARIRSTWTEAARRSSLELAHELARK